MSPIQPVVRMGVLIASLSLALPAAAMSLAPADPELAPATTPIPLSLALGDSAAEKVVPVYQLPEEPSPGVVIAPRGDELLRTSYERELRADIRAASRSVLVEFVESDETR